MLSHFFVHSRAVSFILDSDFNSFLEYESCIKFIKFVFNESKGTDSFGLTYLGDKSFTIPLEEKSANT